MKIIISDSVKLAITDIFMYLANVSHQHANKTIEGIYKVIFEIKDTPYIGRFVPELLDKNFRERIYKGYRIVYYISERNNTIYVQYVFSHRQNSKLFFTVHKNEILKILDQLII